MTSPLVALVFDEGEGAGLGHRRRMESLARAFGVRGYACALHPGAPGVTAPIVVVDSYRQRADDGVFAGDVVVALDDLGRDLAVDVVVDPSPGADPSLHTRADLVLAGAHYAPVDEAETCDVRDDVHTVLVTTGAADRAGHGATLAGNIAAALPDVEVRLVLGTWGAQTVPHGVEGVVAPDGLGAELDRSDLVVTAGGVTLLEALVRGLPTVAVTTAANQAVAVKTLDDAGATIAASVEGAPTIVEALAADADQRRTLARQARIALDGHGSHRIAHLASQVATAKALARVVDAEAHQHHLPPVVTIANLAGASAA